jgi:hypothetical protein
MPGLLIVSVDVDSNAMGGAEKNATRDRQARFAAGDPDMLTRAQVAHPLGISLAEVKRRERVGHILGGRLKSGHLWTSENRPKSGWRETRFVYS